MIRKLLIGVAFIMATLGVWWIMRTPSSGQAKLLHFAIGPVFDSNGSAVCSATVSNASNSKLYLYGAGTNSTYIGARFFAKGVQMEEKHSKRGYSESLVIISPHEVIREDIYIPQGADVVTVAGMRRMYSWMRHLAIKTDLTPLGSFLAPVFDRLLAKDDENNSFKVEWSDKYPLRYPPNEHLPDSKPRNEKGSVPESRN